MNTEQPRLNQCRRDLMLRNAMYALQNKYRGRIAWSMVADICGVGSTSATEICKEIGVNPFKPFRGKFEV
jgi:ribosomal protein S13